MSEINSFSDYTNQILVHCNLFLRATIPMQVKYRRKHKYRKCCVRSKAVTYTSSGSYSNTLSKLVPSTVDERVGDKDKSSDTSSKTTEK